MTLQDIFPVLFGVAHTKEALVEAHMEFFGATNDWEVDVFASFYNVLSLVRMRREGEDKLW